MLGVLAFFDFLSSREKAIIIWAVVLVGFAAYKSDGLGSSFGAVLRSIFLTKLVFLFGTAAAYCAGLVLAANKLALWHTTAIKATVYWFFGTGVVLAASAVTGRDNPDLDAVLVAFGFGLMLWVAVEAATSLKSLLTRENAEDLLLAPALTLAFVPYLQLVAWRSRRELENLRKRWRTAGA